MGAWLNATVVLVFLLGGLAGAWAAAWQGRRSLARRLVEVREQFEERQRDSAQHGDRLRQELEAMLPRVAENVLASKTQQLGQLTETLSATTVAQVGQSQAGMTTALGEMQKRLGEYQERITKFETERAESQGRMEKQIEVMASTGAMMAREANSLRQALATSGGVRGRWGEAVLKNLLESCGLNEGVDYHLQEREQGGATGCGGAFAGRTAVDYRCQGEPE